MERVAGEQLGVLGRPAARHQPLDEPLGEPRQVGVRGGVQDRRRDRHAGGLGRLNDRLGGAHEQWPAEAGRGGAGRGGEDPRVLPLGEDDRRRHLGSPAPQTFQEVERHSGRMISQPLRTIAPVGCGTPPSGSTVTAQASAPSAARREMPSTSRLPAPRASTSNVPAETGRPSAMIQSW